jgi:hypothetical protein
MKLYLDKRTEAQNVLVCGAPGTRKSSLLRSLAEQAMGRGWPVIFTDLKREYVAEFYRPEVDYLFNVADDRCFRWKMGDEFTDPVGAKSLVSLLIPHEEHSSPFFLKGARRILAHLFSHWRLNIAKVKAAIRSVKALDPYLSGSEHHDLITAGGEITGGIMGNLNNALEALDLLPCEEGRVPFSAYEWCKQGKKRKGNIFLSSSANDIEAQKGLQALLLDLLFLNTQSFPGPGMFILDEVGVFPQIPRLEPALNIQRSSGNPIVLAFQNLSQLAQVYGRDRKDSILSSPYTVLGLRMRGKNAVELSELIAQAAEVERVKESKSAKWWDSKAHHSYSSERAMVSPVTAGQITDLEDGAGYLAQAGKITPVQLPYRAAKKNQPDFIPRVWPQWTAPEKPAPASQEAKPKREYKSKYKDVQLPI